MASVIATPKGIKAGRYNKVLTIAETSGPQRPRWWFWLRNIIRGTVYGIWPVLICIVGGALIDALTK